MEDVLTLPCLDVFPSEEWDHRTTTKPELPLGYKAIFLKSSEWKPGVDNKITITFGNYEGCNDCVKNAAWSHLGNNSNNYKPSMNLGFVDPPFEDFTVDGYNFNYDLFKNEVRNYCSKSNTNCLQGWKPGRTIIHEFGHAMGMFHEHQNYVLNNPLEFDEEAVIQYYQSIGYSRSQAEDIAKTNVIDRYECTEENCPYRGSEFDKDSVMLYPLDLNWLKKGTDIENITMPSFSYSDLDKEWLEKTYPKNAVSKPTVTIEFLDGEPWQKYWVKKIVQEQLQPHVGININYEGLGSPTLAPTSMPAPVSNTDSNNNATIIGGVIGGVIGFVLLVLLIKYILQNLKEYYS